MPLNFLGVEQWSIGPLAKKVGQSGADPVRSLGNLVGKRLDICAEVRAGAGSG
jgi:hypothetical protein